MEIRPLSPRDRSPLAAMLGRIEAFRAEEVACALELVDLALERPEQKDYRFLIADRDGALAGYLCFGPTPMTEGTFDLYWIATANEARGSGVGSALVRHMEQLLAKEGGRLVRIETGSLTEYGPARQFYAALGYREAARLPDFYRPGDDLVILTKRVG